MTNIILATTDSYLDVCDNFLELLKLNFKCKQYNVFLSVVGNCNEVRNKDCFVVLNKKNATLPEAICYTFNKFMLDDALVFLGDAFISGEIKEFDIDRILYEIRLNNADYCSFIPKRPTYKAQETALTYIRLIHEKDRYSHSFIAFYATKDFVNKEFGAGTTDLAFELKYLSIVNSSKNNVGMKGHYIFKENYFKIRPGIIQGKWDRKVKKHLSNKYKEIIFLNREQISLLQQMIFDIRDIICPFVPGCLRRFAKKVVKKLPLFETET